MNNLYDYHKKAIVIIFLWQYIMVNLKENIKKFLYIVIEYQ